MIIPDKWLKDEKCYSVKEMDIIINTIYEKCAYVGKKIKYLNIPVSFDIETTSFIDEHNNKSAIMYVWMMGIYGFVVMGRTWDEYKIAIDKLSSVFRTCGNRRHIMIFVHNLSFDFQFLRKHHHFIRVFCTNRYAPLYAITDNGIEFRCSYRLSSLSLANVAKNLRNHSIHKMEGDLDYNLIRHSETPLTAQELLYCTHDVKVVCAYIAECITDEGENISTIPLTNTGYVRRDCREACFKSYGYMGMIHTLTLTPDQFKMCRAAFMGGYVHSNPIHTGLILSDVASLDISSSYPTVMMAEKFPMTAPKEITISKWSELKEYTSKYNCIFELTIRDIKPRFHYDYYISASKCEIRGNRWLSNGRVVYADEITLTVTELDFDIIEYMYKLDPNKICIHKFIYFEKGYLPTPFIKRIIYYYKRKTELADIPEYIAEYNKSKRMLNGNYGMSATNPIRPEIYYENDEYSAPIEPDLEFAINKYNNSRTRFLYYVWAVYITAYARHNIWSAIIECGNDHVYTDTDSEKCLNFSEHAKFFDEYNLSIQRKLKIACKIHGINESDIAPLNKYGKAKPLGIFKNEGTYDIFKCMGAKRYIYKIDGAIHVVASGVNPNLAINYMNKIYKTDIDIFNAFKDDLVIPAEYSGRKIHTYIDDTRTGYITDYLGNTAYYKELSGIHLGATDYNFSVASEFIKYIKAMQGGLFDI